MDGQQWAKVPEHAVHAGLDATALNVFIILSAKAGPERIAWISQRTIGERLHLNPTTIGRAIRRLEKADLIRDAGKVVVDHEAGTWVRRYNIAPYLHEVRLERTSGDEPDMPSDLPEVRLERTSGANVGANLMLNATASDLPEVRPRRRHSVPLDLRTKDLKHMCKSVSKDETPKTEEQRRSEEEHHLDDEDKADEWDRALQTLLRCGVDPDEATLVLAKAYVQDQEPHEVVRPFQVAAVRQMAEQDGDRA